jgi:hypothetical protein
VLVGERHQDLDRRSNSDLAKSNLQIYDLIEFAHHFELELKVVGVV